jgi:hypothetical protein
MLTSEQVLVGSLIAPACLAEQLVRDVPDVGPDRTGAVAGPADIHLKNLSENSWAETNLALASQETAESKKYAYRSSMALRGTI